MITRLCRPICLAVLLALWTCTAPAQDTSNIYAAHCANCHGRDGRGNTPLGRASKVRDLHSQGVQNLSDSALIKIISKGAADGKMPGFGKNLGVEEVQQLSSYVRHLDLVPEIPATVKEKHAPPTSDVTNIYASKCSHCHAANGSGDTVLGREIKLPDLRSKARALSDQQLLAVIAHGTSDGKMAGFQKKLGTEMVEHLASYVRTLTNGGSISPISPKSPEPTKDTAISAPPTTVTMTMQSRVPRVEPLPAALASVKKPVETLASPDSAETSVSAPQNVPPGTAAPKLVDLNSASKDTLMKLPGLTEQDADNIIRSRPYKSTLQFKVRGIVTAETYDRIAQYIIARHVPKKNQAK